MENKNSKILIIILTILVISLSSFIVYDKVLNKNNIQDEGEKNKNSEQDANSDLIDKKEYVFRDFSSTVFQNVDNSGNNYLILWDNGTFSYDDTLGKYLGNYIVDNQTIILNYIFENNQKITKEKSIELTINSKTELVDTKNNVTLNKVNHPTSPGGWDFYYELSNTK